MSSEKPKRGRYNNDYSPKFSEPYDIYDKAREHMKDLRKENLRSEDSFKEQKNAEIPSQKKKRHASVVFLFPILSPINGICCLILYLYHYMW